MALYTWKSGSHFSNKKLPAQMIGETLEQLREAGGGFIKPEQVLNEARSPDSPLHPAFEWDDTAAAEAYRVTQARKLIQSVTVRIETGDQVKTFRAFVSVSSEDERQYTGSVSAMSDEALRQQVLTKAWSDLQAWRRKYAEMKELAEIVSLIEEAEKLFAKAA